MARGQFIALLDSDDVLCPGYFAAQLAILDAHPEASIVTGNAINRGGGVRVAAGSPSFTDCTFRSNIAEQAGAGLSAGSVTSIQVSRCVFRNNTVNNTTGGGGIEATDNTTIVNSVVSQNAPNGMNFSGGGNSFINTTVANNASYGIALFLNPNTIVNSIVYSNPTGAIFLGFSGIATVSYSDVEGGFAGTGNTGANPLFVGAPGDLRLGSGSPAIDSGNNAAVPFGLTLDLAGLFRFHDDPGMPNVGAGISPLVDMGAYEFQGSSTACNIADGYRLIPSPA